MKLGEPEREIEVWPLEEPNSGRAARRGARAGKDSRVSGPEPARWWVTGAKEEMARETSSPSPSSAGGPGTWSTGIPSRFWS